MSVNFTNKRISKIYQGSNLVYEKAGNGDDELIPQKAILIGNTNIARIMQGNELIWGEAYSPLIDDELEEEN